MRTAAIEIGHFTKGVGMQPRSTYGYCPICRKNVHGVFTGSGHGVQGWGGRFREFDDLVCTGHGEIGEPMQEPRYETEEA